jgi:K+-sensing histidine kinase KdpD
MSFVVVENLFLYLVAMIMLAQGVFVASRRSYGAIGRGLFLFQSICGAAWVFAYVARFLATDTAASTFFMRMVYVAAAGVIYSWTAMMFSVGYFKKNGLRAAILLAIPIILVLAFVTLPGNEIVVSAGVAPDKTIEVGAGRIYFMWLFAVYMSIMFFALLFYIWRAPSRLERNRYSYIFVMMISCVLINAVFTVVLPFNYGDYSFYWVGPTSIAALAFLFIASVFRFRLFNFRTANQQDRLDGRIVMDATIAVVSSPNLEKSLTGVVDELKRASRVSMAAIQIFVGDKLIVVGDEAMHLEKDIVKTAILMKKYFATDELDDASLIHDLLAEKHITAIASIDVAEKEVFGAVIIGDSASVLYTEKEMSALAAIANVVAIAYSNSEFARKNLELKKIDGAKDELLDVSGHNLRTPLTIVRGYIELILGDKVTPVNPKHLGYLQSADNETIRMLKIIDDFLTLSRIQTGRFIINRAPTDLREVVVNELTSLQELVAGRGKNLRFAAGDGNYVVDIDAIKIRQVITNFVDNAVFYSGDGKDIFIKLSADEAGVTVEVEDRGIGVPEGERGKLFEKLSRASNAKYYRPDGTGTGLYMIKKIIDGHGGRVIYRPLEQGSVFGFFLPR